MNGQKTWTSRAHLAGWIFVLVRTDPKAANKTVINHIKRTCRVCGKMYMPWHFQTGSCLTKVCLECKDQYIQSLRKHEAQLETRGLHIRCGKRITTNPSED